MGGGSARGGADTRQLTAIERQAMRRPQVFGKQDRVGGKDRHRYDRSRQRHQDLPFEIAQIGDPLAQASVLRRLQYGGGAFDRRPPRRAGAAPCHDRCLCAGAKPGVGEDRSVRLGDPAPPCAAATASMATWSAPVSCSTPAAPPQGDRDRLMRAVCNARVLVDDRFAEGSAVPVDGARIVAVVPDADVPAGAERIDIAGDMLVPGFIDTRVDGGDDVLFNDAPTVEIISRIGAAHVRFGTTGSCRP